MNIERRGAGLTTKILCAMLLVVTLCLTCVGFIASVSMRDNVVGLAIGDLNDYGDSLSELANVVISDPMLMYNRRIRSSARVSDILIISVDHLVVYPTRMDELSNSDVLARLSSGFLQSVLNGERTWSTTPDTELGEMLLVGVPVSDENGTVIGATIMSRPLTEVYSVADTVTHVLLLSSAASLVAAVIIGIVLSKRITKPIIELKGTTAELARGNLSARSQIKNRDEIGMLAQGFNYLADQLSRTITELDDKNRQLTADMDELAKLEQMRKNYIANVSHEFRAPITGIRGFVEPLMDGIIDTPEEIAESYRIILDETLRLERLINAMLDLSKLQSGSAGLELEPMRIEGIVASVARRFSERAAKDGVELDVLPMEGLPQVMGNEDRIDQVLVILIDNALKYTPSGGRVEVSAAPYGDRVAVRVRDNGTGIPAADLPYVFERFYKSDKSRADKGTGLGLAIAREIVGLMGGDISASSEEGRGSEFRFTLVRAAQQGDMHE